MFIKEVILDGFKSYAHRTEIKGFDPEFTAITGLNGSGKSNILDAICFVLGISVLSQVRVNSLQEFIYKQGQAGVTKASVTIVFDNTDRNNRPMGYDQDEITITRQIIVGGRNKYLINGRQAQHSTVQSLFQSVQLNVNNPHFLIMQGRITKVMNMKPPELLGLMEEAAGTRMFELKKLQARKTIEKKDQKLAEINKVMLDEIAPKLERMQKQRQDYELFYRNKTEINKLQRFVIAGTYCRNQESAERSRKKIADTEQRASECKDAVHTIQIDEKRLEEEIKAQREKLQSERSNANVELEKQERLLSNQVVQVTSRLENKQKEAESEKQKLQELISSIEELKRGSELKQTTMQEAVQDFQAASEKVEKLKETLANTQKQLSLLKSGIAADENGQSLTEALMDCNNKVARMKGEIKSGQYRLTSLQKSLKEKKETAGKQDAQYAEIKANIEAFKAEISHLQDAVSQIPYDAEKERLAQQQMDSLNKNVRDLNLQVSVMEGQLSRLNFEYTSPSATFDRSAVKGIVAKLITVPEKLNSTAIEVVAGGRLYNVIVDSEETGKQLLDQGKLTSRITIIPLNKIHSRDIHPEVIGRVRHISAGTSLALQLVGHSSELTPAMRYVFGSAFVCPDGETAAKIAYSKDISCRAVTLEGDEYNPTGTMTGGAKGALGKTLLALQDLNEKRQTLKSLQAKQAQTREDLSSMEAYRGEYQKAMGALETKRVELAELQRRLEQCDYHQNAKDCEKLDEEIKALSQKLEGLKSALAQTEAKAEELKKQTQSFHGGRDVIVKVEKDVEKLQRAVNNALPTLNEKQNVMQRIVLELGESEKEAAKIEGDKKAQEEVIRQVAAEVASLQKEVKEKKAAPQLTVEWNAAKQKVDEEAERLRQRDAALLRRQEELDTLTQQEAKLQMELKGIEHNLKQLRRELQGCEEHNKRLVAENAWIPQHQSLFGQRGGEFDFEGRGYHQALEALQKMEQEQKQLEKTVNMKALTMFDSVEQEYKDVITKRNQVEKDKHTIERVIEDLDRKKKSELAATHARVSADFASIFATLLPGAQAQLLTVKNNSNTGDNTGDNGSGGEEIAGLEIKVGFGSAWKESLSELSGGQRSLLSLSLILALLLFKPAPMYILDEVDAALDLSHTQNIGKMLRTHFRQSQFIVVSLKEGMFNNANVLFRTKVSNGQSSVTRVANK